MKKRRITALMIGMMLLVTGCGSKDAEKVTDYGSGGTDNISTEIGSTAGNKAGSADGTGAGSATGTGAGSAAGADKGTEAGSTEKAADAKNRKSRNGSTLSDQLGGTNLEYQADFQIGQTAAKLDVSYTVNDSPTLESYRLHSITEDRFHEDEIVKAIFGDSAQEVKRTLSASAGDSDKAVTACFDYYFNYGDGDPDMGNIQAEVESWADGEKAWIHTYEGKYNGVDSQLSICYLKDEHACTMALGPKNWGEVIGRTETMYIMDMSKSGDGELYIQNPATSDYVLKKMSDISDQENHAKISAEDAKSKVQDFLETKLHVKVQNDGISYSQYDSAYEDSNAAANEEEQGSKLLFYPTNALEAEGLSGAEINGYILKISGLISNQPCHISEFGGNDVRYNYGNFQVVNEDVAGFYLILSLNFEECISEQVAILPFETAMEAFQEAVQKDFDTTKLKGRDAQFRDAQIVYYPVASPENADDLTYIPAWYFTVYSGNNAPIGEALMNAMDGSILAINYME